MIKKSLRGLCIVIAIFTTASLRVNAAPATPGQTILVSVSSSGAVADQGGGFEINPHTNSAISAAGRFIAFESTSTNLVDGDTNNKADVFVHDQLSGMTSRVSVASDGSQANGDSYEPSISGDGRYIAFESTASNLVPGDTNNNWDVFVHDTQTGQTTRVSVASNGAQGHGPSCCASISADGRRVAFESGAADLVPNDTNGFGDVFVHDNQTGTTTHVSISSNGMQGNSASGVPTISGDGRTVAFISMASNLVEGDANNYCAYGSDGKADDNCIDVFIHDLNTGQTSLVSVSSDNVQGNQTSNLWKPAPDRIGVSYDGRFVAFTSWADNLVSGDSNFGPNLCSPDFSSSLNNCPDVFLRDRLTGQTTRVSVSTNGAQGNDASMEPVISADGRFVAYSSYASNLIENDKNGSVDVFIYDRMLRRTSIASISSDGKQGWGYAALGISGNGQFIAFVTSSNFAVEDTNNAEDVYLHENLVSALRVTFLPFIKR